jgi:hypothetical protein
MSSKRIDKATKRSEGKWWEKAISQRVEGKMFRDCAKGYGRDFGVLHVL